MATATTMSNRRVILRRYVMRFPSEDEMEVPSYISDFIPKEVSINNGVIKVMSSGHPDFKAGDLVWGMTGWEEALFSYLHPIYKVDFIEQFNEELLESWS
uniref:Oxidoreductase N-terminal domain-containing protein n=1 Tax=Oryza barthii TaxID=65489 RepID=A0A0D3HSN1_9ORYZ